MTAMLTWKEERSFVVGETSFKSMPEAFLTEGLSENLSEGEFFIFKPRTLVDQYAALVAELRPQNILELGIFQGGSTVFFAELARPRRVVAIDLQPLDEYRERLESHAGAKGFGDVVRTFGEVDQADRRRLEEIIDDAFDGAPLDLVVDDCSHLYEPTLASFNELFPRVRPGGVYVIEDWRWAHTELGSEHPEGFFPDEVPLSRLLFEIVLALPSVPGLITDISIGIHAVIITRGDATVDPSSFDISACSNPRGQALLAPA
jgi:SAM-dependent methyltransferase